MKAILTISLFLVIASAHFSFGQTQTDTVITDTTTKETEVDTPPIDTTNDSTYIKYIITFDDHFGGTFGVYNFWEATRNLSQSVSTALPAARRFGFGINYYFNVMFNNRHWTGVNFDLMANSERSQNGYTANCFAGNAMIQYGVNVKSKSTQTPLFPFVAFGLGSTKLMVNSNNDIASSNLTTKFSSVNITSNYLAYKVGITGMIVSKKGAQSAIIQLGYLGGINSTNWISGSNAKVTGMKAFALKGVFLNLCL